MVGARGYGNPCDYCVTPSPLTRIWTFGLWTWAWQYIQARSGERETGRETAERVWAMTGMIVMSTWNTEEEKNDWGIHVAQTKDIFNTCINANAIYIRGLMLEFRQGRIKAYVLLFIVKGLCTVSAHYKPWGQWPVQSLQQIGTMTVRVLSQICWDLVFTSNRNTRNTIL